ncbi:MAG: hypothetical protein WC979_08290 [Candidatus Pacearchaeota archaeon]|jgi:hypothetical protein
MVTIKVNIQKRDLFLVSAIMVFLVGAGIVIATGGTTLTNGHDYTEVGIPTCSDNQVLKWSSGKWNCATDSGGLTATYKDWSVSQGERNTYEACGEEFGCCHGLYNEFCKRNGFTMGVLTGSGGQGWCAVGNPHHGYCFK